MAGKVFRFIANGRGGLDWAGLPLACAYYGVRHPEPLIDRLLVIKNHRPDKDA